MILLLHIHIYVSVYMFYFLFEQIVIIVFYLHFRNNFSDSIILVIGLLNSSAVELFEGQYFPLVTNILKDLEVEGEKNNVQKSHCLRLFLSV